MNDKLFVIAIGGTGMRCLESFVHLCAIGMFDNQEIDILTLDTDQSNGNKERVEALINTYQRVKSDDPENPDGGSPNSDTFFSAKLNLYTFATDYNAGTTFRRLASMSETSRQIQQENEDLAGLFLDEETVQDFDLERGYRAQTHLGSMLMYHGILSAAIKYNENQQAATAVQRNLGRFLQKLIGAAQEARVFIFGSVFGGTGASSIPVVPRAFEDAAVVLGGSVKSAKFASTLLTEYFTFPKPDTEMLTKEKIVADSSFFPINSQAALQFYQADPTVKRFYKRLYHIGWPLLSGDEVTGKQDTETVTGGAAQKNSCHIVELMCASAAYEFFTLDAKDLESFDEAQYYYRGVEEKEGRLEFKGDDFMGDKGDTFVYKIGAFFTMAHVVLTNNGAAYGAPGTKVMIDAISKEINQDEYSLGISEPQAKEIDEYLRLFAYRFENDVFTPGWIYQINRTKGNTGTFLFNGNAFKEQKAELIGKYNSGNLFLEEKYNWEKERSGIFSGSPKAFDTFKSNFKNAPNTEPRDEQNVKTTKERFLAKVYNTIKYLLELNNHQ